MYKSRYFITFYDANGEEFITCFDSVKDILAYQKRPITENNLKETYRSITLALRREDHSCHFLTGEPMTLFIIEI